MSGLRVAMVGAHPPSRSSLSEYLFHLASALIVKPEITELMVLSDDLPEGQYPPFVRAAWRTDSAVSPFRILRTLRRERPDLVVFNIHFGTFGSKPVPAALGLLTPLLARSVGMRTMVILHNLVDLIDPSTVGINGRWKATIYRRVGRLLTRGLLASGLVAVTVPRYVEHLRTHYRKGSVVLVPHGSFGGEAKNGRPDRNGTPRILAFGKFGTYKRLETLVDAHRLLRSRRPLELVVAGADHPSTPGYLASMARSTGDHQDIRFIGYVPEDEVGDVFASADLVVLPYQSTTGSSGVLHQAGDYGRPVVLPAIGDFVDLMVEEGFAGEFFEPDDPLSLAAAIEKVLDDTDRRDELARQNRRAAAGLPMPEVADWHLLHMLSLVEGTSDGSTK